MFFKLKNNPDKEKSKLPIEASKRRKIWFKKKTPPMMIIMYSFDNVKVPTLMSNKKKKS